ncbi:class I SAM-dependent methyltransferase [Streptomyces boninensis]|uniref:class I SAM-dependent methyltransferase n=1 Tax=Streptomyces boninensis TaxID=2039455 RepID=UPI003B21EEF5
MTQEYIYDTGSELGTQQVNYLADLLDGPTTRFLEETGVGPGWRCLDVGAGFGSITRWLAERVGSEGRTVAVDLATDHLAAIPGVEAYRHDINDGLPDAGDGPYDLIHARLVLLHLPRREEILKMLVGALAPGGWLVLGDFSGREFTALEAPSEADRDLWHRFFHSAHHVAAPKAGLSTTWAHEAYGQMAAAGLTELHAVEHSETSRGGTTGCLLYANYIAQIGPLLREAGTSAEELARLTELMAEPRFVTWHYQCVFTRGRKNGSRGQEKQPGRQ